MCPNKEWFWDMKECEGSVPLGNNNTCKIRGVGNVKLRLNDGSVKVLSEVRFIPEVKRNLISLGTLERRGYLFISEKGEMKICKNSQVKMMARRKGSLYYPQAEMLTGESHASIKSDLRCWHLRLGHPAKGTLKALIQKGAIDSSSEDKLGPCEDCLLGKAKKLGFPAGKHTSTSPLDYAHSDLWGLHLLKAWVEENITCLL
ncbi:uncharacterized mitochondrial protein AtMg00300-like [Salvia splendens]|uniref:uncharacterized mitochondrial protein AtMg00300-like n=1 Tax=Salvia splendens TaxID=180675 RepID=UPI001C273257|nr:uncharacterized mitochondrial protein AtMg00300-like [Salvia splendens]